MSRDLGHKLTAGSHALFVYDVFVLWPLSSKMIFIYFARLVTPESELLWSFGPSLVFETIYYTHLALIRLCDNIHVLCDSEALDFGKG